ncbi:MAG: hypothetical protein ACLS6O_09165 [Bifidobacterium sp.]
MRREFRGFGELAFSNVDSLVLSELSYMRLLGLVPDSASQVGGDRADS